MGKKIGGAIVEALRVLCRTETPVSLARLILGIHRFPEKNFIAVRSGRKNHVSLHDPAGYRLALVLVFIDRVFDVGSGIAQQRLDMQPFFGGVEHDEFTAAPRPCQLG